MTALSYLPLLFNIILVMYMSKCQASERQAGSNKDSFFSWLLISYKDWCYPFPNLTILNMSVTVYLREWNLSANMQSSGDQIPKAVLYLFY